MVRGTGCPPYHFSMDFGGGRQLYEGLDRSTIIDNYQQFAVGFCGQQLPTIIDNYSEGLYGK